MWDQGSKGWGRGSEGWDLGPQPWDQESQTMGSGSAVSYQGPGFTTFVGSGMKIGHAFGIKEQKFVYKNGISDEKTYLVTTLLLTLPSSGPYKENIALSLSCTTSGNILPVGPSRSVNKK